MSYLAYKLIHLLGIFSMLVGLGGMAAHAAAGHAKEENKNHRALMFLHGFGALVALTGGFGLLARLELESEGIFPWLVLGGLVALPYRKQTLDRNLLLILPVLAFIGAYLANYKPF